MGFEIAEQLGWKFPRHTVVPMASGSLLTKISKAYKEFRSSAWSSEQRYTIHGAQAAGCSPISAAFKRGTDIVKPVPEAGDHRQVARHRHAGRRLLCDPRDEGDRRRAEDCTDEEIVEGIKLLAESRASLPKRPAASRSPARRKLIETGKIPRGRERRALHHRPRPEDPGGDHWQMRRAALIKPSLREFEELIAGKSRRNPSQQPKNLCQPPSESPPRCAN